MVTPWGSRTVWRVSISAPAASSTADLLLEAQVQFHLDTLSGEQSAVAVSQLTYAWLAATGQHTIGDLADPDEVTRISVRMLQSIPSSAATAAIVSLATEIAYDGPPEPYPLDDLVDRERVEHLLDALLALNPALERATERLTDIPLVGTVASRFMGRIVGEVLQANQAAASKVPGLGTLMSFGTGTASRVMGAADKQFEALVGSGLDKGGSFAVRRLSRILVETLRDPSTREAALQVWDLIAKEPVTGLDSYGTREEIDDVVDAGYQLAVAALASEPARGLVQAVVNSFFERFGRYTVAEMLDELGMSQPDLVADVVRLAPPIIEALRETGDLERILRTQLEPFYASPEVAALLN